VERGRSLVGLAMAVAVVALCSCSESAGLHRVEYPSIAQLTAKVTKTAQFPPVVITHRAAVARPSALGLIGPGF